MHTTNSPSPVAPLAPGDPAYDRWFSELQYFLTIKDQLLAQPGLRSTFVALQNHQIIDNDPDMFALSRRMDTLHPNKVVFITQVIPGKRAVEIPGIS